MPRREIPPWPPLVPSTSLRASRRCSTRCSGPHSFPRARGRRGTVATCTPSSMLPLVGTNSTRRRPHTWPQLRTRCDAAPGSTTPRWSPTSSRTPRSGSSDGSPTWSRPTSPRRPGWRRSRSPRPSAWSPTPAARTSRSYSDAGLTNIAHDMASAPPAAKVKAGLDVEIQNTVGKNANKAVPNSQAIVTAPVNLASLAHHDQLVGRERRPQRGRRARDELDGRHPAVHRRHPRDRQQRQLQRLRAHRRGRSRLLVQGHHLDRAVRQRDSEQPAVAGQLPPDVQGPGDHLPQRPE